MLIMLSNGNDDAVIKNAWAKQGFYEFIQYFKYALPQTYPERFHSDKQKLFGFHKRN